MSLFDGLDIDQPIVKQLSERYNIPPTVIAYLRAALMRQDHKYDKASLQFHIMEENGERKKEIQQLQRSVTEANYDQQKAQIAAIQKKMDFRQGVLTVLRTVDDKQLQEILQVV